MIDTDADPSLVSPLYRTRRKVLPFSQPWKWNRKHCSSIPPEAFHPFLLFMKLSINSFFFVSVDITRSLFSMYSMTYHLSAGTVCSHQDGPLPRPSFCFPSTWIPYYEGVSFILLPLDTQSTCISGALLEFVHAEENNISSFKEGQEWLFGLNHFNQLSASPKSTSNTQRELV